MSFGITAVKSDDPDKVLDSASEYYSRHNLSLAEVVVGEGDSKYIKKRYKDLDEFREAEHHDYKREFNNHFDFFFNLDKNEGWVAFSYDLSTYPSQASVNVNEHLAIHVSSDLDKEVFEYYEIDTTGYRSLRRFRGENKLDELFVEDAKFVAYGKGYFEEFKSKDFESATQLYKKVLDPYYEKIGFYPRSDEFSYYHKETWRHFYLEGSVQNIKDFIENEQKLF